MTKQRALIMQILNQPDRHHLTADEIFFLAKLQMPTIAMATVYNNLNAMHEAGLISRFHTDGGADCFDRETGKHDHLLCDSCGKLTDIHLPDFAATLGDAVSAPIESYDLTVHYICPECRRRK